MPAEVNQEAIDSIRDSFNENLKTMGRRVDVKIDKASGNIMVIVYDQAHDTVVMTLPPKSLIDLRGDLRNLVGHFIEETG